MTLEDVNKILTQQITFELFQHKFKWRSFRKGNGFLIQLCCEMIDNETGIISDQHGGKHYISAYAVKDEIVNKAWYACQDFIIHEAREAFKYKGQAIYHPHWTVDKLTEYAAITEHAKREEL